MRHLYSAGLICMLCSACQDQNDLLITTENDAISVADNHLLRAHSNSNRASLTPRAIRNEGYWLVTYSPQEGTAGGGVTVLIERATGDVVTSYGEQ